MARPPSRSAEDRVRIVLAVLRGEVMIAEAARREGVSAAAVAKWRDAFLEGGAQAVTAGGPARPTSREEQLAAENEQLAAALGEAHMELRLWRKGALRGGAWLTASDSGDGWSLPFDAAGEEEPEPVVVEVAEAVAGSAGVLDEQVHGLGGAVAGAVGGVEGEELVGPAVDGRGEPDQLGHIGLRAPLEERDQASAGVVDVDSAEHGPQELLGQPTSPQRSPASRPRCSRAQPRSSRFSPATSSSRRIP